MIIDFSKAIEGEFYPINETVSLDNSILDNRNGKFISDAIVTGWFVVNEDCVAVKCDVKVSAEFTCDRCLAPTVVALDTELSETFFKKAVDEESKVLVEDRVDLQPCVDERVLLAVPTRILCKPDCKGLCPKCGTDLNFENCDCDTDIPQTVDNRFAILLDKNISSGGNKNGSTKM